MKIKEHVLLASILVTLICIILYETGVLKVEAQKNLFANDKQKSFILKSNEENVVILPGTKMNVSWNTSEGKLKQTGSVVYTTINASLLHVTTSVSAATIPVDQIQELIVHKGTKAGKYGKNGFLLGGAVGAFLGLTTAASNDESGDTASSSLGFALCSGLTCGITGAIAGATVKNKLSYPIGPNDWEIIIE